MLYKNGLCFVDGKFQKVDIKIENGKITEISNEITSDNAVDCSGRYIIPGFVDIHTHGCCGFDFSTATKQEIETMLGCYAKNGTTSLLATTVSMVESDVRNAVDTINSVDDTNNQILGINLEGPFLSRKKRGAHDENVLCNPDIEFIRGFENIKEVCIAPELEGANEFIAKCGKLCSVAHTDCDYETALKAFSLGANHITHMFNAMNGLNHRNPGVIGAFAESDAVAELICDFVHVSSTVVKMMFKLAHDRIAVISDSMAACGLGDGSYKLGNLDVTVKDGVATLADSTIAGSTTFLSKMVRNLIDCGIEVEQAILSATLTPADSIGAVNKGRIKVGCDGDLLICDENINILNVILNGVHIK